MNKNVKVLVVLMVLSVLAFGASSLVYAENLSPIKMTAYEHDVKTVVTGNEWWQSGNIHIVNKSNASLRNWTVEFDANTKILKLENVKYSVKKLQNGQYRYTVSPVSWKQWSANKRWTHKNAIQNGEVISIKIYGNRVTSIQDLKINNTIVSDQFKDPIIVDYWMMNKSYEVGEKVIYNNSIYICKIAHTSYAANWTPVYAPSLWRLHR